MIAPARIQEVKFDFVPANEAVISETDPQFYDEDYFERGLITGKSLYTNYRWLPELTLPLAHRIIRYLKIPPGSTVLDYGCAKGYLVKALRLLDINAWGFDISEYALKSCDEDVRPYCTNQLEDILVQNQNVIHYMIAKDVFEHMQPAEIYSLLTRLLPFIQNQILIIVPLGERGRYHIPAYQLDRSHVIAENLDWWKHLFTTAGYQIHFAGTQLPGLKPNWEKVQNGNGFFIIAPKDARRMTMGLSISSQESFAKAQNGNDIEQNQYANP